jgi:hypothetical protein
VTHQPLPLEIGQSCERRLDRGPRQDRARRT